jgi:hypothetical protein
MRGGAELPIKEMTPVSDLFLKLFDGNTIGPDVGDRADGRLVSTQTGLTGTVAEVSSILAAAGPAGLGMEGGGKRSRWAKRSDLAKRSDRAKRITRKQKRRGTHRDRKHMNLRASRRR